MGAHGSVTRLIQDLRSTDSARYENAARLIWERYFRRLLDLAQADLDPRVRRREDEENVLQSMYASFCRRQRRGDFDLANRDELWGLLMTITLRKVRNAAKRRHRLARDVGRELGSPAAADGAGLKLEGYTNPEIAAELSVTERTVERKLERIPGPVGDRRGRPDPRVRGGSVGRRGGRMGPEQPGDRTWIDEVADRFECAWREGPRSRPRIEEYLADMAEPRARVCWRNC